MRLLLHRLRFVILGAACLSLACLPKLTTEQIQSAKPTRPPELNCLDMFLGEWETTGTIELAVLDEPIHTSGRNAASWTLDGRVLLDRAELHMGPFGRVVGQTLWTWDESIGKHRMWWFDSLGETSEAVASFDVQARTWRLRAHGQKYGRATSGRGTIRQVDENTLEWTWTEASASGLIRFADMRGTSRRVPAGTPERRSP